MSDESDAAYEAKIPCHLCDANGTWERNAENCQDCPKWRDWMEKK